MTHRTWSSTDVPRIDNTGKKYRPRGNRMLPTEENLEHYKEEFHRKALRERDLMKSEEYALAAYHSPKLAKLMIRDQYRHVLDGTVTLMDDLSVAELYEQSVSAYDEVDLSRPVHCLQPQTVLFIVRRYDELYALMPTRWAKLYFITFIIAHGGYDKYFNDRQRSDPLYQEVVTAQLEYAAAHHRDPDKHLQTVLCGVGRRGGLMTKHYFEIAQQQVAAILAQAGMDSLLD